jgi:Tol biopolymer transport system component
MIADRPDYLEGQTASGGVYSWIVGDVALLLDQLPITGERKRVVLSKSEFTRDNPHVSPNGHWIAYNSLESGRWEVYVAAFPSFNEKRQVSVSGGCQPMWRKDGKELFYRTLEGRADGGRVQGRARAPDRSSAAPVSDSG